MTTNSAFPLPNFSIDLADQVAVVTGASSGIGRRFAQTLAAAGATVAAVARRADRVKELANEIGAGGGSAIGVPVDITDDAALVEAVEQIESELGPINILVNNAGIPDAQYATKMSPELIDAVIDTNLRAPFMLSCEVARRMIKRKSGGRMVNVSSMGAHSYGGNGAALYSITKAAVERMTETLSVEWAAFNINVNCIAPGAFNSEMMDGMLQRVGDITKGFPRRRMGEPAQLDSTLLYLVSPASQFVTGTVVKVDDGQGTR
jgi:NAD(P)-dependent dehydrogenase (short-subunit alcohol dehydrogenase family)